MYAVCVVEHVRVCVCCGNNDDNDSNDDDGDCCPGLLFPSAYSGTVVHPAKLEGIELNCLGG